MTNFRAGVFGVTADIKHAFFQISLRKSDWGCLRFLWWSDTNIKDVVVYRHKRVVFGVTVSPYLLNATLQYHFSKECYHVPRYKNVVEKLSKSFYCDDWVSSVNHVEELNSFMCKGLITHLLLKENQKFNLC